MDRDELIKSMGGVSAVLNGLETEHLKRIYDWHHAP